MPDEKPFDEAVVLDLGADRGLLPIAGAREASEFLMADWPTERGPRHRDALETCLKVLDGHRSTMDAKQALIDAASEAGILAPSENGKPGS
jgi:hypothetical protein